MNEQTYREVVRIAIQNFAFQLCVSACLFGGLFVIGLWDNGWTGGIFITYTT